MQTIVFNISLAGRVIEVSAFFESTKTFCKDYLTDSSAEDSIEITAEDIAFEREKSAREDKLEGIPVREFSDAYLETLAVYRKIADGMIMHDTILFHGSVIAVDGVGYLFTAKSGTGKSTHTRLWREYFGERAVMVNDDKPLIRITEEGALVYGTPWDGKHRLSTNFVVPLKAICVLERGEVNKIQSVTKKEIYSHLMQQMYRPRVAGHPERMVKTLELLDSLAEKVSFYRLECNMEADAARVAYEGMK